MANFLKFLQINSCSSWKQIAVLCVLVIVLALHFGALGAPSWVSFGKGEGLITMGLSNCSDCPVGNKDWGWNCFKGHFCEGDGDRSLCSIFEDGYNASYAYLNIEGFTVLALIMVTIRMASYIWERDFGPVFLIYGMLGIILVIQTAGLATWFATSQAGFNEDCEDMDDPKFCAEEGPGLAVASYVFTIISVVLVFLVFWTRTLTEIFERWGINEKSILCLSVKWWMLIILVLQLLVYGLILGSMGSKNWVERDAPNDTWSGGVLRCDDCPYEAERAGWECFAGVICDQEDPIGNCEVFEDLSYAGNWFVFLELVVLGFMLLWTEVVLYAISGREFGLSVLNYALPWLTVVIQLAAVATWFAESGVEFGASCDKDLDEETDKPELCPGNGPVIAICATVFLLIAVILFTVVYFMRGDCKKCEASGPLFWHIPEFYAENLDKKPEVQEENKEAEKEDPERQHMDNRA